MCPQTNQDETAMLSCRVLLVEDSAVNRMLTTHVLKAAGHDVDVAKTGNEAVVAIQSQAFDVVLMDVEMPEMDGLEATRRIRKFEQRTGTHVPIVGLTSVDRHLCLEAGMDEHLQKTTQDHRLLDTIRRMLRSAAGEVA